MFWAHVPWHMPDFMEEESIPLRVFEGQQAAHFYWQLINFPLRATEKKGIWQGKQWLFKLQKKLI